MFMYQKDGNTQQSLKSESLKKTKVSMDCKHKQSKYKPQNDIKTEMTEYHTHNTICL